MTPTELEFRRIDAGLGQDALAALAGVPVHNITHGEKMQSAAMRQDHVDAVETLERWLSETAPAVIKAIKASALLDDPIVVWSYRESEFAALCPFAGDCMGILALYKHCAARAFVDLREDDVEVEAACFHQGKFDAWLDLRLTDDRENTHANRLKWWKAWRKVYRIMEDRT